LKNWLVPQVIANRRIDIPALSFFFGEIIPENSIIKLDFSSCIRRRIIAGIIINKEEKTKTKKCTAFKVVNDRKHQCIVHSSAKSQILNSGRKQFIDCSLGLLVYVMSRKKLGPKECKSWSFLDYPILFFPPSSE